MFNYLVPKWLLWHAVKLMFSSSELWGGDSKSDFNMCYQLIYGYIKIHTERDVWCVHQWREDGSIHHECVMPLELNSLCCVCLKVDFSAVELCHSTRSWEYLEAVKLMFKKKFWSASFFSTLWKTQSSQSCFLLEKWNCLSPDLSLAVLVCSIMKLEPVTQSILYLNDE